MNMVVEGGGVDQPVMLGVVPGGSGAAVVHRALASAIPGYQVCSYPPREEYRPWALCRFRRRGVALVHAPQNHAVFVCPPDVPLVVTLHGYSLDAAMRAHSTVLQRLHYATDLRFFTRLALRRAAAVTAVSAFIAEVMREDMRFRGNIEVIPNGVDTSRFFPTEGRRRGGRLRVLFSGNLLKRKGAHLLPEVARLAGPDVEIHYTMGTRASSYDPRWGGLHPVGRVAHDQMPSLYRQFDVLLLPTVREGMSLALLEAMASGLAVVASDAASNPELVADGRGGYLCPVNEAEAYAAALRTLAANRSTVAAMGLHNRRVVLERYDRSTMVEKYRNIFSAVLAGADCKQF